MAFQISPGVNVSEVDLTTVVPSVSTTAGAFVGDFQWGPAEKRTLVTTENELASVFGQPSANTSAASGVANTGVSFFSAANFLAYGNNLQVVRAVGSSTINSTTGNTAILLKNEDSYDNGFTANSYHGTFGARYAGALGNSLKVSVCTANATNGFASWTYKSSFAGAPSTTPFVSSYGGANDQIHIAVIDEDGLFTGTKDTVLEAFAYVSQAPDAVYDDGTPAYWKTVIRNNSKYIYALNNTAAFSANTDVCFCWNSLHTSIRYNYFKHDRWCIFCRCSRKRSNRS